MSIGSNILSAVGVAISIVIVILLLVNRHYDKKMQNSIERRFSDIGKIFESMNERGASN